MRRLDLSRRQALCALLLAPAAACHPARAEPSTLDALLGRRRMVRRYLPEPVSDARVERLLRTATRAPSAGNTQPWAFVVVRESATRQKLGKAAFGQMWLADAPVVVVACADVSRASRYRDRAERYARIDAAFASLLLLLAVTEEGLGACFVGAFDDAKVARLLKLPSRVLPLALIPIGHPAESPGPQPRRPLRDAIHRERWGKKG